MVPLFCFFESSKDHERDELCLKISLDLQNDVEVVHVSLPQLNMYRKYVMTTALSLKRTKMPYLWSLCALPSSSKTHQGA
jgi:hypothetical protein